MIQTSRWAALMIFSALSLAMFQGCDMMSVPDEPPGGNVAPPPMACTGTNGACGRTALMCCAGTICKGGACRPDGTCSTEGRMCNSSYDCCGTLTCNSNKVCSGLRPQPAGTPCEAHSDCDELLTCRSGICRM